MTETAQNQKSNTTVFTSVQAYTLAVITLVIGIAVGYFARGSAPSTTGRTCRRMRRRRCPLLPRACQVRERRRPTWAPANCREARRSNKPPLPRCWPKRLSRCWRS